jgi:hypothetical protein
VAPTWCEHSSALPVGIELFNDGKQQLQPGAIATSADRAYDAGSALRAAVAAARG